MSEIIHLLPDSVANQIAAGEVVQRPASVVKELVENAIDAEASHIYIILKNVGKTSIQIVDDGKGMSPIDARMAFERHATSKISSAGDLFNILTLGFRGEALPSIASVSEVELRTRPHQDELGTYLYISASAVKQQETVNIPAGTNIIIKNLFFNIPARRKFLKSDTTELRNSVTEFIRVAMAHPDVNFTFSNNDDELYNLPATGLRQRIVNIFGKNINSQLINVECNTELIKIKGFVCHPKHSKKTYGEQYFFANGRFMKHPMFHKAIQEAFSGLIAPDVIPSYFLYFTVDPAIIDVNIHPTKTEIKFQGEMDIFQIIVSATREALGKYNVTPSIDFDTEGSIDFTSAAPQDPNYRPSVSFNSGYNPFQRYSSSISPEDSNFEQQSSNASLNNFDSDDKNEDLSNENVAPWHNLFQSSENTEDSENSKDSDEPTEGFLDLGNEDSAPSSNTFIQMKGRYIVSVVHAGLMFIDQKRAHERILFEQYCQTLCSQPSCGQKSMFPETIEVSAEESLILKNITPDLEYLGFEITEIEPNIFSINTLPADLNSSKSKDLIHNILTYYQNVEEGNIRTKMHERVAQATAKATAMDYNTPLSAAEMSDIVDSLFACQTHNFTADGKTIIFTLGLDEINNRFK